MHILLSEEEKHHALKILDFTFKNLTDAMIECVSVPTDDVFFQYHHNTMTFYQQKYNLIKEIIKDFDSRVGLVDTD